MNSKDWRLFCLFEPVLNATDVEEYNTGYKNIEQFVEDNAPFAAGQFGNLVLFKKIKTDTNSYSSITIARYHTNPYLPKEIFEHSFYLPSNLTYKKIGLSVTSRDKDIDIYTLEIETEEGSKFTNFREMKKKLIEIGTPCTETEIMDSYNSLTNEQIILKSAYKSFPKTIKDKLFGTLKHDGAGYYEGKFNYQDKKVKIDLSFEQEENIDFEKILANMHRLVESDSFDRAFEKMIKEMLVLKNEAWQDDDEMDKEVTEEEFRKLVKLISIQITDQGESSLTYFADDKLFFGHNIQIRIAPNGEYKGADLVG